MAQLETAVTILKTEEIDKKRTAENENYNEQQNGETSHSLSTTTTYISYPINNNNIQETDDITNEQIEEIMSHLDRKKRGKISYADFQHTYKTLRPPSYPPPSNREQRLYSSSRQRKSQSPSSQSLQEAAKLSSRRIGNNNNRIIIKDNNNHHKLNPYGDTSLSSSATLTNDSSMSSSSFESSASDINNDDGSISAMNQNALKRMKLEFLQSLPKSGQGAIDFYSKLQSIQSSKTLIQRSNNSSNKLSNNKASSMDEQLFVFLTSRYEEMMGAVVQEVQTIRDDFKQLERTIGIERKAHKDQILQIERDAENQLQMTEVKVKNDIETKHKTELSQMRLEMQSKISELQDTIKKLREKESQWKKRSQPEIASANGTLRLKLNEMVDESKRYQTLFTDAEESRRVTQKELSKLKTNYQRVETELKLKNDALTEYISQQEKTMIQMQTLCEANQKLHDTNDVLRSTLEDVQKELIKTKRASEIQQRISYNQAIYETPMGDYDLSWSDETTLNGVERNDDTCCHEDDPEDKDSGISTTVTTPMMQPSPNKAPWLSSPTNSRLVPGGNTNDKNNPQNGDSSPSAPSVGNLAHTSSQTCNKNNGSDNNDDSDSSDISEDPSIVSVRRTPLISTTNETIPNSNSDLDDDEPRSITSDGNVTPTSSSPMASQKRNWFARSRSNNSSSVRSTISTRSSTKKSLSTDKKDKAKNVNNDNELSHKNSISSLQRDPDHTFRVVLCGDCAVGKSSLIIRACKGKFENTLTSTLGVDFQLRKIELENNGGVIGLQLWDTAGQERFRSVTKSYFRRADAVILVYDISYERSFLSVREWMQCILDATNGEEIPILLVGNKLDLRRDSKKGGIIRNAGARFVQRKDGREMARENDALFMETSAKDGDHIDEALIELAKYLVRLHNLRETKVELGLKLHESTSREGNNEGTACFVAQNRGSKCNST